MTGDLLCVVIPCFNASRYIAASAMSNSPGACACAAREGS